MERLEYEQTEETAEWLENPETKRLKQYLEQAREQWNNCPLALSRVLDPQSLALDLRERVAKVELLEDLLGLLSKEAA